MDNRAFIEQEQGEPLEGQGLLHTIFSRLRENIWPTVADIAAELLDAADMYNGNQPDDGVIASAELDALEQALADRSDIFAPLTVLVQAIETAQLSFLADDADNQAFNVAFARARAVLMARRERTTPAGPPVNAPPPSRSAEGRRRCRRCGHTIRTRIPSGGFSSPACSRAPWRSSWERGPRCLSRGISIPCG